MTCAGLLSGGTSGVIRANGGNASTYGGGGGGRIAIWIGVPDSAREQYLLGTPGRVVMSQTPLPPFAGSLSVTNGTSGTSVRTGDPGTFFFFTLPMQGTFFSLF